MTDLFWASVFLAPAALVVFVPFATYLYLRATRRTLRSRWMQELSGERMCLPRQTSSTAVMAVFFVVLSQAMATALVVEGLGSDPFAGLALTLGLGEWTVALAWVVLLIRASS